MDVGCAAGEAESLDVDGALVHQVDVAGHAVLRVLEGAQVLALGGGSSGGMWGRSGGGGSVGGRGGGALVDSGGLSVGLRDSVSDGGGAAEGDGLVGALVGDGDSGQGEDGDEGLKKKATGGIGDFRKDFRCALVISLPSCCCWRCSVGNTDACPILPIAFYTRTSPAITRNPFSRTPFLPSFFLRGNTPIYGITPSPHATLGPFLSLSSIDAPPTTPQSKGFTACEVA